MPFRLHEYFKQRQQGQHEQHEPEQKRNDRIGLVGIIGFYPSTDWTRTRKERDATNPIAAKKSMITPKVSSFFDNSYLLPETLPKQSGTNTVDMSHPYLSPGLAPTEQLLAAYPPSVALYMCAWDQLLVEENAFRERLRGLVADGHMAHVGGMVMEGVIHAFDKKPSFWMGNRLRDEMYRDAIQQLRIMWRTESF